MKKNNINLRVLFIMLLSIVMIKTNAQTGLNFQGVARTSNNVILASQAITIKLSILQGSATGTADYSETRKVMTNAQGLFTAVIGDTGAISTLGNFTTINWKISPKFLKIEMDAAAGTNFITMGTTQFQYVAYAQFAKTVDAENIVGIVPVTLGGTGVNSLTGLKTALAIDKINNIADSSKPISKLTQAALDLKLNVSDTSKYVKQTYTDSALLTKLSTTGNATTATSAGTASTATKLATARSINGVGFDGSGDITVTADAGTLTGTTLKSTVTGSSLTSVGTLANLTVTNAIAGSITGNAATATTATTATKLATARSINGVGFDGSGDITVTADAGTLTGTTLKSTITGSSLTSVGTIASLSTGSITNSGKIIVGATSAASASAVLEASSTTQGFLPPRMTRAQRNAINTPASGLVVWCNNCGAVGELQVYSENATWTNLSGTAAAGVYTPTIGEAYQGGKVAYVLQLGDPGYDPTTPHGLIAATLDQSEGIRWYNGSYTTTGATATAIGTGLSNTNSIITSQGATSTSYAAGLARAYAGGGYADWYLPSRDELNKLYLNRIAIGGFKNVRYWSSTVVNPEVPGTDEHEAWYYDFSIGDQRIHFLDQTYYVRAIRAF